MANKALYVTEAEVEQVLEWPAVWKAVEQVMGQHAQGEAVDFPRQRVRMPGSMTHMLQGGVPALGLSGFKVYTSSNGVNRFWVHLFDAANGDPVAVIEADRLGMMRTGAAGGIAARILARDNARKVALFGAGWQAEGQAMAIVHAMPHIERFDVFARVPEHIRDFCERMRERTGKRFEMAENAEAAVRAADIIVTATTSPKPLFNSEWVSEGVHINAIGSNSLARQEVAEAVLRRSTLICVDTRETAVREAGDLLPLLEKGRTHSGRWVELGELINGQRTGRTRATDLTVFESQGLAIQDIAVAALVLERARALSLGQPLPY